MKLPSRATVVVNVGCTCVQLWLYGGDLLNWRRARVEEASAMQGLPNAWYAVVALALTFVAIGVSSWGAWRERPDAFKGHRLPPIVFVLVWFVDLFVLTGSRPPEIPSADLLSIRMAGFSQALQEQAGASVPSDPQKLEELVTQLGQPPYLVHGVPAPRFSLQVRAGCDGPVKEAPGAALGTLLYCTSPDAKTAWLTVVALPAGELFGTPEVFTVGGEPRVWTIRAIPHEPEPGPEPPAPSPSEPELQTPQPLNP